MTAQTDIAPQKVAGNIAPAINKFEASLRLGWLLSPQEMELVAKEFRSITIEVTERLIFSSKRLTPKREKGMTDEARAKQKAEIDQFNAMRSSDLYSELRRFFSHQVSDLLTRKIRPHVNGLVLLHCPNDAHFTLIPERDAYVGTA
jgi:hypothetical protein